MRTFGLNLLLLLVLAAIAVSPSRGAAQEDDGDPLGHDEPAVRPQENRTAPRQLRDDLDKDPGPAQSISQRERFIGKPHPIARGCVDAVEGYAVLPPKPAPEDVAREHRVPADGRRKGPDKKHAFRTHIRFTILTQEGHPCYN